MNQASRDLLRVLRDISRSETRERKLDARGIKNILLWGLASQALLLGLAIGAGIVHSYAGTPRWIGPAILLVYYLSFLAFPVVVLYIKRQSFKDVVKTTIMVLLWNVAITAKVDARYLPKIMAYPLEDIESVLLEVRAERAFFERRVGLMVGAVETVGMFPGLLALVVSVQTLPEAMSKWVVPFMYAFAGMYLGAFVAHYSMMRMDRMLALLDSAVARKKAEM